MSVRTTAATLIVLTGLAVEVASAGAIRLDAGGDWDIIATDSTPGIQPYDVGFNMAIFGISGNQATVRDDGSLRLDGGSSFAEFDVLLTGTTLDWMVERTNDFFPGFQPGIEAGFRVTWSLDNDVLAQFAIFSLSGGGRVLEFNYDDFVSDASVGYQTGLGESFDLLATLGLSASDLPNFNSFNGGPAGGTDVLPDLLGGYFRLDASFGDPVTGRYIWVVSEPPVGALFMIGFVTLLLASARRRSAWLMSSPNTFRLRPRKR